MAEMYVYTDCRLAVKTEPIYYNRNKYLDIQEFKPNDSDNLLGFRPGQQLLSETWSFMAQSRYHMILKHTM